MRWSNSFSFLLLLLIVPGMLIAQDDESKYKGAIYKESDVPEYVLPEVLKTFSGTPIQSIKEWEQRRKPEILKFFAENLYGKIPTPKDPILKSFEVIAEDSLHLEGLCTRRDIKITFQNEFGSVEMPMVLFIPNQGVGPFPVIYWLNLNDIQKDRFDLDGPQGFGRTKNNAPLKQLMLRGIALASIDAEALGSRAKSRAEILDGRILDLFFQTGQKSTKDDEWGLIAVWAYAMMGGMDYLVADKDINAKQIAALGASVAGKTAIWAAAQDPRISMVLSATSGHGGDALWKRQFGETLDNMLTYLPRWIARSARKYEDNIEALPVDQHLLLACLAPRPLYVSTAIHDLWADPKGQWQGVFHAAPAYQLYTGESLFKTATQPAINHPIIERPIGYHLRSGFHGLQLYDWERFMEFIEFHFLKISPRSVHKIYYPNGKLIDHYPNK